MKGQSKLSLIMDVHILDTWKCVNCSYFDKTSEEYGLCRRFPPILIPSESTDTLTFGYPVVRPVDGCGAYMQAKANQPEQESHEE